MEQIIYLRLEQIHGERFLYIGISSAIQSLHPELHAVLGSQHDKWYLAEFDIILDLIAQFKAIHPRHHDIRNDKIHKIVP